MILIIQRDVSYLSEMKDHGRAVGKFFMGPKTSKNTRETNGVVHTVSKIMKM